MKTFFVVLALTTSITTSAWACGDAGSRLGNSILGIQSVLKEATGQEDHGSKIVSIVQNPDSSRTYIVTIVDAESQTKEVPYEVAYNRGSCVPLARRIR